MDSNTTEVPIVITESSNAATHPSPAPLTATTTNTNPKEVPLTEKGIADMSYPELTLYVITDYYTRNLEAPNQTQIVKRIVELFEGATGITLDRGAVQSCVSRALKRFVKYDKVIKSDQRRYIPYNDKTCRELLKEEIINTVHFGPQPVFQISSKAWLIDVEKNSLSAARALFTKYLGSICYNVLEFNGYLMLLFSGKSTDTKEIREEILKIYKAARSKAKGNNKLAHSSV